MDLSKLPKLSESSQSAAPPPAPSSEPPPPRFQAPPPVIGGEIWFNVIIAIILLFFGRNFLFWSMATLTHQPFHTNVNWTEGPNAGQEVSYFELEGYTSFTETGMFLFGLAVLLEAAALVLVSIKPSGPARGLVLLGLGLTILCTVFNLVVSLLLMSKGMLPIMSGLATAFGGYMVISLRGVLQNTRP